MKKTDNKNFTDELLDECRSRARKRKRKMLFGAFLALVTLNVAITSFPGAETSSSNSHPAHFDLSMKQ